MPAPAPLPVDPRGFNAEAVLPHGLRVEHLRHAMEQFVDFLRFIDAQLEGRGLTPFEHFLMPANFSSIVGEFMTTTIPRACPELVKNRYHNGHPDLVPKGRYPDDAVLHGEEGIEIKASRKATGWQGHNPENAWLMVFVFSSTSPNTLAKGKPAVPFRFEKVVGAQLTEEDWKFSGRTGDSRRTITATVTAAGRGKMEANWIYRVPR